MAAMASLSCAPLSARHNLASRPAQARASPAAVRAPLRIEAKESRIGKNPVAVPKGVTYTLKNNHLFVKVRLCRLRDLKISF